MKWSGRAVVLFSLVCFLNVSALATITGEMLWVPKTVVAPEIDGRLDGVWKVVTKTPLRKNVTGISEIDDWFDLNATFRLMWDPDNLYIFVHIMDEAIKTDYTAGVYEKDGVELYFDGDNNKTAGAFDGQDDVGVRFNVDAQTSADLATIYGASGTDWGFSPDQIRFAVAERIPDWEDMGTIAFPGWNLEAAIPLTQLEMTPTPGHRFGYETQVNDNDKDAVRDAVAKWWNESDDTWKNAALFGTCFLSEFEADSVLNVLRVPGTEQAPAIDAVLDDIWLMAPEFSDNTPVLWENRPGTSWTFYPEYLESFNDHSFNFRMLWDPDYLYIYYSCRDDEIMYGNSPNNQYVSDSFGFYFDPDNSKGTGEASYDNNNLSHHFALSEELIDGDLMENPNGILWAYRMTEAGYDVELALPMAAEGNVIKMDAEAGHVFGFDVIAGDRDPDNDDDGNQSLKKWWNADNNTWADVSTLGTARLSPLSPSVTSITHKTTIRPAEMRLLQNYPNPFNNETTIEFNLPGDSHSELTVFDIQGRKVAVLLDEYKTAGRYKVGFNAMFLPSGVYFYRLNTRTQVVTRKMIYVR